MFEVDLREVDDDDVFAVDPDEADPVEDVDGSRCRKWSEGIVKLGVGTGAVRQRFVLLLKEPQLAGEGE